MVSELVVALVYQLHHHDKRMLQFSNTEPLMIVQPAVSVGNVGQLAVDLLISTLNMPRVGYFHTDCLTAMAGNSPYAASAQLSTGAEVYSHRDLKLAVLQIRTPIIQVS
uniref:Proteasome assembly chaperone 2 n=1 Tax=Sinocyclocheilus anshuiensis TaxID=1608454 RepID=A0A671MJX1_9TELE